MKKYIALFAASLLFATTLVSCTAEPLETKSDASEIKNPKAYSYIGVEPVKPGWP